MTSSRSLARGLFLFLALDCVAFAAGEALQLGCLIGRKECYFTVCVNARQRRNCAHDGLMSGCSCKLGQGCTRRDATQRDALQV